MCDKIAQLHWHDVNEQGMYILKQTFPEPVCPRGTCVCVLEKRRKFKVHCVPKILPKYPPPPKKRGGGGDKTSGLCIFGSFKSGPRQLSQHTAHIWLIHRNMARGISLSKTLNRTFTQPMALSTSLIFLANILCVHVRKSDVVYACKKRKRDRSDRIWHS